ncbi:ribonuclease H-like domain-containing protein, partial [Tanacetum coccineum]
NEVYIVDRGVPYDDSNDNASSQCDGSNHPHHSSSTIDHNEDDLRHLHGSNGSASEDEMAATFEEQISNSEGINNISPSPIGAEQVHQPLKTLSWLPRLNKSHESKTFWEASSDQQWVDAMNKEMDALYENNTWEITEFPSDRKAIGSKWVFKIKYKSSGEIERYKARLVAKDVQNNWPLFQSDFNNAFIYGDMSETVYISLPDGYFDKNDKRAEIKEDVKISVLSLENMSGLIV